MQCVCERSHNLAKLVGECKCGVLRRSYQEVAGRVHAASPPQRGFGPEWLDMHLAGQVVSNAVKAVKHLRALGCVDIEFSPEDAGRSEPAFLYRVLSAVIEAGATTLNIPDTVCGSGLRVPKFG